MVQRVIGIFKSQRLAANAVEQLGREGFDPSGISVLLADSPESLAFLAGEKSTVAEGAVVGSTLGGTLGAVGAGALSLTGLGIIAAGPLAAALAAAGIGAASGGLLGALVGSGMSEPQASLRTKEIQEGAILVAVDTELEAAESAGEVLTLAGADEVIKV